MKHTPLIFFLMASTALLSACSYRAADQTEKSSDGSSATYQLVEIEGHTPPDGGFYELDQTTGQWCERPTAADMMAYAKMNDLENPDDVPDLTNFFGEQATGLFKSCRITIHDRGENISLTLNYDGKAVYAGSVDKASIPAGGTYEFRVKNINGFDLPEPDGSLVLTGGADYVITYGAEPSMSFTNDVGEYFLKFRRVSDSGQ